jgi:ribosomal protein L7Ae-like RNA K-turn-binding protein
MQLYFYFTKKKSKGFKTGLKKKLKRIERRNWILILVIMVLDPAQGLTSSNPGVTCRVS